MLKILIKKSALMEYMRKSGIVRKELIGEIADDPRFEQFKNKVLEHLDSLEEDEKELEKSLAAIEVSDIGKAGYPVGTIREWKGKKYIKMAQGKWRPKYDSNTRGAKMAVALLKRKASACMDSRELLQLILENRERFSDAQGRPLPFVKELSEYVSALNDKLESEKTKGTPKKVRKEKDGSGGDGDDGENEPPKGAVISKKELENLLKSMAMPMPEKIEFTKENFDKYFAGGVDTPIGKVKVGEHQFQKLKEKGRQDLIVPMYETLKNPCIIGESENGAKLYVRSFINENSRQRNIISVVVDKGGISVSISTHEERALQIAKKISGILYKNSAYDGKTHNDDFPHDGTVRNESVADNSNIPQSAENVNQNSSKSTIETIREKYQSSKSIDGDDDSITLPDGTELEGKWKLVEADAPSASHDERTFKKTEGFPSNADGSTINDRDYEHDSAAKEAVIDMAGDFDSRALGIDSPVVVSEDGVVISGNNRTMSSKIAARKGTDRKYVDALAKKARKFGFSSDDVAKFKNPRVVFEIKVNGEYSTSQFAKFNESGKKAQSPVEVAVKVSKTVNAATIESVAEKINQYDTLGELYADQKSMREVFSTLIESGVIKKTDLPAYYTDEGGITNNGKEFLETVLIGSVINESNIRSLSAPGGKEIRQKLVRAIVPLVENKGMKGYSIASELNDAVNIALDIKKNKKFKDAEDYSRQGVLIGENPDPIAIEFAKKLEGTQKDFAEFMRGLNVGLKPAANGEADIFAGGIESRDDILSRYISIKKSIRELLDSF